MTRTGVCKTCGKEESAKKNHIHHIDRDRKHNGKKNLIEICPKCHGHIHTKYFRTHMLTNPTKQKLISLFNLLRESPDVYRVILVYMMGHSWTVIPNLAKCNRIDAALWIRKYKRITKYKRGAVVKYNKGYRKAYPYLFINKPKAASA